MDIGSPWHQNGNGSSPTENGVKDHEEEMEMAASVRLLTRFRHMAGSQLDDLVVRPLPAEMKGQLTLMLRLNATMRSKPFNPSLKRQAVKSIYQASETP
jgi:hypothetical protein